MYGEYELDKDGNQKVSLAFKGASGIIKFANCLSRSKITQLNISHNSINYDCGVKLFEGLSRTNITELNFRNCSIDDVALIKLAECLPHSLRYLDLSKLKFSEDSQIKLAKRLPQTSITELKLSDCDLNFAFADKFAEFLPNSKIEKLDLSDNSLTWLNNSPPIKINRNGLKKLVKCLGRCTITEFNLCYTGGYNSPVSILWDEPLYIQLRNTCRLLKLQNFG